MASGGPERGARDGHGGRGGLAGCLRDRPQREGSLKYYLKQLERNSGHRLCDGDVESEVLKAGDQPAGSPGVVGLFEVVETEVPVL